MAQYHDAPEHYLRLMRESLPLYDRLQDELARAGSGTGLSRVARPRRGYRRDLTTVPRHAPVGEGDRRRRSPEMLELAAAVLGDRAELRCARLEDPLPRGSFDHVVSALAVHHLDGPGKADLFARIWACLAPGGRFVMGDVIAPDAAVSRPTPLDPSVDKPDRLDDLLDWLVQAGLGPEVRWAEEDLAVVAALRRPR